MRVMCGKCVRHFFFLLLFFLLLLFEREKKNYHKKATSKCAEDRSAVYFVTVFYFI